MFGEDDLSSINIFTAFILIKYFSSLHLAIGLVSFNNLETAEPIGYKHFEETHMIPGKVMNAQNYKNLFQTNF